MAQISENSSGGKRGLNAEVNLVPFIDLLSVCICFLLVAAVWLQIGSVQVKQSLGEEADTPPSESFELALTFENATKVNLTLKKGALTTKQVPIEGATKEELAKRLMEQVEGIQGEIATLNPPGHGEKPDLRIASATIVPHEKAPYSSMIAVMDALRKREIVNLAVTPRAL